MRQICTVSQVPSHGRTATPDAIFEFTAKTTKNIKGHKGHPEKIFVLFASLWFRYAVNMPPTSVKVQIVMAS